jgi:hypothetical protein
MAAKDITNALKYPHPEVPFDQVGDEKIIALTQLAEIFKKNSKNSNLRNSPIRLSRPPRTQDLLL